MIVRPLAIVGFALACLSGGGCGDAAKPASTAEAPAKPTNHIPVPTVHGPAS